MRQILHVAQCVIVANRKNNTDDPAIIVRNYKGSKRAHEVELVHDGKVVGKFIYCPHDPLPCGARLWFESESELLELRTFVRETEFEFKDAA